MTEKEPWGRRLLLIATVAWALLIWAPITLVRRVLLRLVLEIILEVDGRRMFLVYSRSPVWEQYIEHNWLPRLRDHAIILNWSDRSEWGTRKSLAVWVFRHWAPTRDFNPSAIVFPRFRWVRRIGFYGAFRDWKHGNHKALKEAEGRMFGCVGETPASRSEI